MESHSNVTDSRSSSLDLDGRRPTAGGMPPYQEGKHYHADRARSYQECYNSAMKYYRTWQYVWTPEQWKQRFLQSSEMVHTSCDAEHDVISELWQDSIDREHRVASISIARDKLQRELGPREFTLTYSPAWYADDATAKDAMRVAIDKLTRYYKHDIIDFHAIGEYTEAGRGHVHCYYELDGGNKITDKNFKRAWKHWNPHKTLGSGHQGGHHANVRSKSDFLGYIEKDLDTAWMNVHITRDASETDRTAQTDGDLLQEAPDRNETPGDEDASE